MDPKISMDHGGFGDESRATLAVDRQLKSGKLDTFDLSQDVLLRLIEEAAFCLKMLRKKEAGR